ncbi:hypothetical protein [Winogradskyella endarachnes]|uniref:Uncharacterized protein n=1 Tax=Winogradskyella endarachnes TaxID=2681965 RepID=A0A6L6UBW2_9FLAO|nr:hypothetical protein [Winogradskyella endarachnes]MUU79469.1 hypothetical protein [Winogradskyella endarachnes]
MKNFTQKLLITLTFIFFSILNTDAQVRIGGGVEIDIRVDLPEIIVKPAPRENKPVPKPKRPIIIKERLPKEEPCHCNVESYGQIMHQNNGRVDYSVVDGFINYYENSEIDLVFNLESGDQMMITVLELNSNDYNFHYNANRQSNAILNVSINGVDVALNSGAVALQPTNDGYNIVLNLHSAFDGSFHGTVNL